MDDEFAELVLGEFSENFDLLPAEKVNFIIHLLWPSFTNWMWFAFSVSLSVFCVVFFSQLCISLENVGLNKNWENIKIKSLLIQVLR